jgi:hypothetical protein
VKVRRSVAAPLCDLFRAEKPRDFVDRRKLDFVDREKRILLVAFSRKRVDFRRETWSDGRFTASIKS